MDYRRLFAVSVIILSALCLDASVLFGQQGAVLQQPAKVTMTFKATDAFIPGESKMASEEEFARYLLYYPMPPMPGPTYDCKRADVLAYPQGSPGIFPVEVKQVITGFFFGGEEGGEIITKGCCDARNCGHKDEWPLRAGFQVTAGAERQAHSACRKEWRNRIPNPVTAYSPYKINTTYPGVLKIRYCYLNMKPTGSVSVTGMSASAEVSWHTDCTIDNVTKSYNINYPIEVTCRPQPIKAAHAATAYQYSCSQNRFVVKGTTKRSTDRMTPIPQPIPGNTCVPMPELQAVVKQTCPPGYVVRGTNLNSKQTATQQPETCVWPAPAGQVQTQQQRIRELALHPDKPAKVSTQYHYTCPANYVIPGTTMQAMSYPTTKSGLVCDPKPGTAPVKADIWLQWKHSCSPGMIIHGSQKQREVFEVLPQMQEVRDRACLPANYDSRACPFIFTQEAPGGDWLAQGTILTHHNGKDKERTEVVELGAFSGSILIQEIDPETSYMDSLSVVLTYADGSTEVLQPEIQEPKAADGSYLVTNQGDAVVVGFSQPSRAGFVKAEVHAHGYYEPY